MGKKIRAAKASLVAAFLAAGGAATAKSVQASPVDPGVTISGSSITWGDQLVRFLKLDGFPAYLKIDGFAQLTQYYKEQIMSDAASLYIKWPEDVSNVLALYQKADAGPLDGILVGLEQYWKYQKADALQSYLKLEGNIDNYAKFQKIFQDLQAQARTDGEAGSAYDYFWKLTGIGSVPDAQQILDGGVTSAPT